MAGGAEAEPRYRESPKGWMRRDGPAGLRAGMDEVSDYVENKGDKVLHC